MVSSIGSGGGIFIFKLNGVFEVDACTCELLNHLTTERSDYSWFGACSQIDGGEQ